MRVLLLAGLLAVSSLASAAAPPQLLGQAEARSLWSDPYWLALLHYAGGRSEITSAGFFLAPGGRADPRAELAATLEALFASPGVDPNAHAQCRFVARYRWLRRQLDWSATSPPHVECPKFQAYAAGGAVESVSVIYATGYLSNPASFYGHILIKFNAGDASRRNELLAESLNFGAAVPQKENPLAYIVKGLFGGYDATFTDVQFFTLNHAYAENELRDLWEYVLALPPDEVEQLVAHSWELLGQNFDYYFLKQNCAFRMAQLLEIVVHRRLLPALPWSLPASLFDGLMAVDRDGKPLVREVRRIPSRQSRFRERYAALSTAQRAAARAVVDQAADFTVVPYQALDVEAKIAVADTLLDYYEYRLVGDRTDDGLASAKQKVLAERVRLPPRRTATPAPASADAAAPPHEGPLPFLARLGVAHNSVRGDGVLLRLRPASYDTLALDAGRIPDSTLAMFDLSATVFDGALRLRRFDIFNVENFDRAGTRLPSDGGTAWKLRAGLEAQDLACTHCTAALLEGGLGGALALGPRTTGLVMLDARAQTRQGDSGWLAVTPRLGVIATPGSEWKTYFSLGRRSYLNGTRPAERVARWELRLGRRRDRDVRISYEQSVARELQAALSFYW